MNDQITNGVIKNQVEFSTMVSYELYEWNAEMHMDWLQILIEEVSHSHVPLSRLHTHRRDNLWTSWHLRACERGCQALRTSCPSFQASETTPKWERQLKAHQLKIPLFLSNFPVSDFPYTCVKTTCQMSYGPTIKATILMTAYALRPMQMVFTRSRVEEISPSTT